MPGSMEWTAYVSLLVAGLAGSLHCIGMCGPILFAFSQAFARGPAGPGRPAVDFAGYHAGRIWTYGMLGLVAGSIGSGLRGGALAVDLQRVTSLLFVAAVILSGVVLAGWFPSPRLERVLGACGFGRLRDRAWFSALVRTPGFTARLLLGALMGLLPCGLVYAALVLAATLPTPGHAALGMLLFGIGTLPSLSAVLIVGRTAPRWLRLHGTRVVGLALILVGGMMLARTLTVDPAEGCPVCAERPEAPSR